MKTAKIVTFLLGVMMLFMGILAHIQNVNTPGGVGEFSFHHIYSVVFNEGGIMVLLVWLLMIWNPKKQPRNQ